ncbi:hypothetical protein ACLB2K_030313 [Fragaria x ananassa]
MHDTLGNPRHPTRCHDHPISVGSNDISQREDTINCHHYEPFIINVQVNHYRCHRALVDTGAAVSVMFSDCYKGLRRDRTKLYNNHDPLVSLSGEIMQLLGSDRLTIRVSGNRSLPLFHYSVLPHSRLSLVL